MEKLSTRVALVTGGAVRVGRAIVEKLAGEGFDVAFTYLHSLTEANALVQQIESLGRRAVAIEADLTDPTAATSAIGRSFGEAFGRLDVLVNNASIYQRAALSDVTPSTMQRLFAIHAIAPALLCQSLAPLLRQSRGHVINMLDLLSERPWPAYLAYCASKGALTTLTLGLARELAPEVTVNGIAPGVVAWPADYPQAEREKYLQRIPLARAGTPQDVAALVYFLATGGSYITGQILRLDGGRSLM